MEKAHHLSSCWETQDHMVVVHLPFLQLVSQNSFCTLCCQLACLRANKVKRLKQGYYKKLAARNQARISGEKDHD